MTHREEDIKCAAAHRPELRRYVKTRSSMCGLLEATPAFLGAFDSRNPESIEGLDPGTCRYDGAPCTVSQYNYGNCLVRTTLIQLEKRRDVLEASDSAFHYQ